VQDQIEACMPDSDHIRHWQGKGCRTERQVHTQQLTFMRECSMTLDRPKLPVRLAVPYVRSSAANSTGGCNGLVKSFGGRFVV
jgi:hypothetical protein